MDTWILQGGYPLVSVEGTSISQEPFAYAEATGSLGDRLERGRSPSSSRSLDGGHPIRHLLDRAERLDRRPTA